MLPNRPSRLFAWLVRATFVVAVAVCSVFVTTCVFPCGFEFGNLIYAVSPVRDQVTVRRSLSVRVLARLEAREQTESDSWLRDDLRIAWLTVQYAARGEAHPHFWATYAVLRTSPDQVWPMIEARRRAALGERYDEFFGVSLPPKKSVQSASEEVRPRAKAAAA